jgi:membrane protease YdiL (CAAX protease family)
VRERSWFFALSGTAGVCEEALYRGFLIWYLLAWAWLVTPHQAFLVAAIGSSLLFGAGHAYQGVRGALLTAAVGGFLAAVYWITRSLFAGMVIHALMDLHAGYLSHLAYRRAPASPDTGTPGA